MDSEAVIYGSWRSILTSRVLALCLIGFLINCKPSEPFLTRYLEEVKGLSSAQLASSVWPCYTYGSTAALLPVGLAAERWGYQRTIAVGLACREMTRVLLLYGQGVSTMAVMQLVFAAASSIDTVLFAYLYLLVEPGAFKAATATLHAAFHLGNILASLLGQMLVSHTEVGDNLTVLFYISWGSTTAALGVFILCLPPPSRPAPPPELWRLMRPTDMKSMYSGRAVQVWSLWWVLGFGGFTLVINYYQMQLYDIDPKIPFGMVEVLIELAFACGAALPIIVPEQWFRQAAGTTALFFICSTSGAISILWFLSTLPALQNSSVNLVVLLNVLALVLYSFLMSAASISIALCLQDQRNPRYALVFALNTFVALTISSFIQLVSSHNDMNTSGYYTIASLEMLGLTVCIPLFFCLCVHDNEPYCSLEEEIELPLSGEDGSLECLHDEDGPVDGSIEGINTQTKVYCLE